MSAGARPRLAHQPALDGLRAVAVAGVVAFHLGFARFRGGSIGVDVFFVLSGFLITTLLLREHAAAGRIDLADFWRRRGRRLLPSLLVVAALATVLFAVDRDATGRAASVVGAATALSYLSAWVAAFGWWSMGWMGHTWSLSVEELFYLAFPLALVPLLRRVGAWSVLGLTVVAVAGYLVAARVLHWSDGHLYSGPDMRAQQLLIGCSLAVVLDRVALPAHRMVLAVLAAGAGALLLGWATLVSWTSPLYLHGGETIVALAAAAVVGYLFLTPHGLAARLLSLPALVWVGRRSYTIYLVHYPLIGLLGGTGGGVGVSAMAGGRRLAVALLVVPATLVYAAVSYARLERRFLTRRPASAAG